MGHLMLNPSDLPAHIRTFVAEKAGLYIDYATDTDGLGARYFILKPGFQRTWTYQSGSDTVMITYDIDAFNPRRMRMIIHNVHP